MTRTQDDDLRHHYRRRQRPEVLRNLAAPLRLAHKLIAGGKSLAAPRPYRDLTVEGKAWIYAAPYWIAYSFTLAPVIFAVFFDQANIPEQF